MISLSKFLKLLRINSNYHNNVYNDISYMKTIFNLNIIFNFKEINDICTKEKNENEKLNLEYQKYKIPVNIDEDSLTNNHFDAYIIKWPKNSSSPPHQHPERGCFLKVLDGDIQEQLYNYPVAKLPTEKENLFQTKNLYYHDISFLQGFQTHIIKNIGEIDAYTLHIYGK